jgi:hypothetical protein
LKKEKKLFNAKGKKKRKIIKGNTKTLCKKEKEKNVK